MKYINTSPVPPGCSRARARARARARDRDRDTHCTSPNPGNFPGIHRTGLWEPLGFFHQPVPRTWGMDPFRARRSARARDTHCTSPNPGNFPGIHRTGLWEPLGFFHQPMPRTWGMVRPLDPTSFLVYYNTIF